MICPSKSEFEESLLLVRPWCICSTLIIGCLPLWNWIELIWALRVKKWYTIPVYDNNSNDNKNDNNIAMIIIGNSILLQHKQMSAININPNRTKRQSLAEEFIILQSENYIYTYTNIHILLVLYNNFQSFCVWVLWRIIVIIITILLCTNIIIICVQYSIHTHIYIYIDTNGIALIEMELYSHARSQICTIYLHNPLTQNDKLLMLYSSVWRRHFSVGNRNNKILIRNSQLDMPSTFINLYTISSSFIYILWVCMAKITGNYASSFRF